ncbi:MAG: cyclase family protein [Firmicutes bacterium]|nr:cyclase family protein [Bacillota bacterium]
MKIYDITAVIGDNLPAYGNERPIIDRTVRLEDGNKYNFTKLGLSTHTGTHADMPSHIANNGMSCDTIPLDRFYGPARLIRIATAGHITKADLLPFNIEEGSILLIDTGQSKYMQQGTLKEDFFALTTEAAQHLVEKKIKTLGIDYLSVDPYDSEDFPVHMALLGNGVTVLEGLVLDNVPEGEYTLSALPLKIAGGDGSPVRAVLMQNL